MATRLHNDSTGFQARAYPVEPGCYITQMALSHLIRTVARSNEFDPAQWSVIDAQCFESMARSIRKYYGLPEGDK